MPYASAKQRAYLHIHHPEIAARWDAEYGGKVKMIGSSRYPKKSRKAAIKKNISVKGGGRKYLVGRSYGAAMRKGAVGKFGKLTISPKVKRQLRNR